MFRFEHTAFLWLLWAIPLFIIIFIALLNWKKNAIKKLVDNHLVQFLIPEKSRVKPYFKFFIFILIYTNLVLAMANPQIGSKLQEVKRKGVDVMIALDLSNSMLAEDIKPSRLESAKRAISKFIEKLKNDRIGIVVFGGQAYTQLPITTDFAAAKLFLNTISTDMIPTQGTAIGAAIEQCKSAFNPESKTSKVIVILTDGENHEDDASKAAAQSKEEGILVHTIGMGSPQGSPIPLYQGRNKVGFRKDNSGNSVVTKLNEPMLQEIAASGGGIYVRASSSSAGLDYVLDEINKMEKAEFGSKVYTDYEDRFQYFLGFAIFLLILDFFITEKKNKWLNSEKLFGAKA